MELLLLCTGTEGTLSFTTYIISVCNPGADQILNFHSNFMTVWRSKCCCVSNHTFVLTVHHHQQKKSPAMWSQTEHSRSLLKAYHKNKNKTVGGRDKEGNTLIQQTKMGKAYKEWPATCCQQHHHQHPRQLIAQVYLLGQNTKTIKHIQGEKMQQKYTWMTFSNDVI